MDKPSLPKGTRDFGPAVMARRLFLIEVIKGVFKKFGFAPLETPAMENLSTLTGKYGEEGDQLLFRILDSGHYLKPFHDLRNRMVHETRLGIALNELFINVKNEFDRNKNLTPNPEHDFDEALNRTTFATPEEEKFYKLLFRAYREEILSNIHEWLTTALESNDNYSKAIEWFKTRNEKASELKPILLNPYITEKGLRYDLTVPFARYVVMNRHEISLPFKRYQIQPVWRADRPQKGRYREFYQCDADVVGTDSLICETEILLMIKEAFLELGIRDYTIKINHRGVLSGLAEIAGLKDHETTLFVAIDKLDKIGESGVRKELEEKGVSKNSIDLVFDVLNSDDKSSKLQASGQAKKGLRDLEDVFTLLDGYGATRDHVEFDIKLARGLSYYTGSIFEVKINNVAIGSVSGGGRYDNLTQAFGSKERLSGVGISFGIDRIYDAMEELNVFPANTEVSSQVLVCHFNEESMRYGLKALHSLRQNGIASEIYPEITKKINKQLEYADKKMIPFTVVIGDDEIKSGLLTIKNMRSGEQLKKSLEDIIKLVKIP